VLFFCRLRTPFVVIVVLLIALVIAWIAWEASDLAWSPSPKGEGAWLILLIAALPIWIRVPLLIGVAGELVRLSLPRLAHAFDNRPDFVVGPDGIGGVDYMTFRVIPWTAIQDVEINKHGLRIVGPDRKANVVTHLLAGKRHVIIYSRFLFKTPVTDVLLAIRHYRPDLANDNFAWLRKQAG